MEARSSNSQGPNVTKLVAGLGLLLLIVIFTASTLCAAPSEAMGTSPYDSPDTGNPQAETSRDSVSYTLPPQAVEVSTYEHAGNQLYPGLRVMSLSLAGLASSEPRFNGVAPVTPAEASPTSPFAPAPMQVSSLGDASLNSLTVAHDGTRATLSPEFDPDVTIYGLSVDAATVNVVAETTEAGARIIATTVGAETAVQDLPGNRLSTGVPVAEGAVTRFSVTVRARDGVTTRTYHLDLSRPGPASAPYISPTFGFV